MINDYQQEQAAVAEEVARRLGVKVKIIQADNDAITQSQQLLRAIQSPPQERPTAIAFEPVGTALERVAQAAAEAQIGWVVLNRDADYIPELRKVTSAPVFAISSDHVEVGRIQGRQIAALLPNGGIVLYIQGPSGSSAAEQRTAGMEEMRPEEHRDAQAERAVDRGKRVPNSFRVAAPRDLAHGHHRLGRGSGRLDGAERKESARRTNQWR